MKRHVYYTYAIGIMLIFVILWINTNSLINFLISFVPITAALLLSLLLAKKNVHPLILGCFLPFTLFLYFYISTRKALLSFIGIIPTIPFLVRIAIPYSSSEKRIPNISILIC